MLRLVSTGLPTGASSPPPRSTKESLGHPQAQPRRTVTYRRGLPGPWTPTRGNDANRRPPRPTLFPLRFGDHLPKFRVLRAMPKGWLSLTPGTSHTLETPSPRHLSPFVGGLLPLSYKYWRRQDDGGACLTGGGGSRRASEGPIQPLDKTLRGSGVLRGVGMGVPGPVAGGASATATTPAT